MCLTPETNVILFIRASENTGVSLFWCSVWKRTFQNKPCHQYLNNVHCKYVDHGHMHNFQCIFSIPIKPSFREKKHHLEQTICMGYYSQNIHSMLPLYSWKSVCLSFKRRKNIDILVWISHTPASRSVAIARDPSPMERASYRPQNTIWDHFPVVICM